VDRTRFLTDDGHVDSKAVKAWADRIAPISEETGTRRPVDLGQGARGAVVNTDPAAVFGAFMRNQLNNT
jgi:hypothetical protein